MDKSQIVTLLDAWIRQRPGLDFHNYGDVKSYRAEIRSITLDLQHARALLRFVEWHDSITADKIMEAARSAFMGRLDFKQNANGWYIDYCTGQYWPTEYRRAACAVLSAAIWGWYRDECLPKDTERKGDAISTWARGEFGRGIGARWFR